MTSIEEIIKREVNPFDSVVWRVGNFWQEQQNRELNVDSIHQEAIAQITEVLARVATDHCTRTLLLLGDSGSGKSHLLGRLKSNLNDKAFFVYIDPFTASESIWRHILRYTVDSLVKVPEGKKESQLLLWLKSLSVFKQQPRITKPKGDARKAFINKLRAIYPTDINNANDFFGVLYQLLNPELHRLACDWLRGDDLHEDDLKSLGVSRAINTEDTARQILSNFGRIAADTQPLVLCFDQLDNIARLPDGSIDMQSLFSVNSIIHNQKLKNFLLVISIINDSWRKNWNRIHPADLDRIDARIFLKPIALEQAEGLWAARLYPLHQQATLQPESPIYPLTRHQLELKFPGGKTNPRTALTVGHQRYQEYKSKLVVIAVPPIDEKFLAAFKLAWSNELKKNQSKIYRIRDLSSEDLIQRLEEALKALQVGKIEPKLLHSPSYASYSLKYQPRGESEVVGVAWMEYPNMTGFSHFMNACEKAVKENLCQTLYLIRAESMGKQNNKGYQIFQQLFTGSPHRYVRPDLTSVHYLATYYNMMSAATSRELVIGDRTPSVGDLQLLIRQSEVLNNCRLLRDLGIVTGNGNPNGDGNGITPPQQPPHPLTPVKEYLLNIVITQQFLGLPTLIANARNHFTQVDASQIEQLIQELCQSKKIQILDPHAKPEEQLVCLVAPPKKQ
jgi:hypothetical protein